MPCEVGELVVCFLALARPFIIDVQKVQCGVCGSTPFIWEPTPEADAEAEGGDVNDRAESDSGVELDDGVETDDGVDTDNEVDNRDSSLC